MSRISDDDLQDLIDTQLPWVRAMGMTVETIGEGTCRVRLPHRVPPGFHGNWVPTAG